MTLDIVHEFGVFSQWGEDGIIQRLVSTLDVENRSFIEFGVAGGNGFPYGVVQVYDKAGIQIGEDVDEPWRLEGLLVGRW